MTTRKERAEVTIAKLRGLSDQLPARISERVQSRLQEFLSELVKAAELDTNEPSEEIDRMLFQMDSDVDTMIAIANRARS